ncbi:MULTISPECIES: DUF4373 domain-containing protein [unclassified Bacteroides]|jgi:hypothetical protein|uniref:DUF4373 domain-containing protein n=1 Tax=unclassified Bacteroides TaxID=2646097 RepID=UPI000E90F6FB|nr:MULTISPECIES: DUF4373 domain-containing protein [unclassified Bacteroides]RGN50903.1 DUF4373 domain-containing protein [Bacteroides sp. OM05-12]RHR82190.1 DUF4373 domain-containing protein [Bacteroides sp. AF16-49]
MAVKKKGLDYFPFDTSFFENDKIQFVGALFGMKGENVVIRLLCRIYSTGYCCKFGEDEALLFAKRIGGECDYPMVVGVVNELVRREFFHREIFERFGVLTSVGIQQRFFEAAYRRRRVDVYKELLLIDVSEMKHVRVLEENVDLAGENVDILSQSKVEESKVNKKESPYGDKKEDKSSSFALADSTEVSVKPELSVSPVCPPPAEACPNEVSHAGNADTGSLFADITAKGAVGSGTEDSDFVRFQEWIKKKAPYCSNPQHFTSQLTEKEFNKLKEKYTGKQIADIIEQIENRKDLRKRYTNLYRTVLNWAKKEYG